MAFVTEWAMTAGSFTLPLRSGFTYNMTVDWGDGSDPVSVTAYNDANATHTYAAGTFQISITGTCQAFYINNGAIRGKLTKVVSWGDVGFAANGLQYAFAGCYSLTSLPSGAMTGVSSVTNLYQTFYSCTSLTSIPSGMFDNLTAVAGNAFYQTFYNCASLASIPADLFKYCTSASTYGFQQTFQSCTSITSVPTDLFRYNTAVSTNGFLGTFASCSKLETIPTDLFRYNTSVNSFYNTFYQCSKLSAIPDDLFKYNTAVGAYGFYYTFYGCSSLTSIPTDLFRYNTSVSSNGFAYTFSGCSKITSIPTDLFRYNTSVSDAGFNNTFYGCSSLTSIPTDLFRYNTAVSSNGVFGSTFYGCSSLTSIPVDLFRYNTSVTSYAFYFTFFGCSKLESIPDDLFRYNTNAGYDAFNGTFSGCSSLTSIPTDLFRYNTNVSGSGFWSVFASCTKLETVPVNLFKYNTNATSFYRAFYLCPKLQRNKHIFFAEGEEGTRFLNKSINFQECFYNSANPYAGVIGEAPPLWDCNFGSGTPTKTDCFGGSGNSLNSLYNYCSIPSAWGATGATCNVLLSSVLTRVNSTTESLTFRLSTASVPTGGIITCYASTQQDGIESPENIVASSKYEDYIYEADITAVEGMYYVLMVYTKDATRETLTNNAYHYSIDQKETTVINITSSGDHITLSSPRTSFVHGLCVHDGYLYGAARGEWNGSTIGQSLFKLKADDYTVLSSVKFYSNKTAQTGALDGCDQVVYCKGFIWCQTTTASRLIRINPSDLDYMVFWFTDDVTGSQPIGTDGVNIYVNNDTHVIKLDADALLGSFASYGYDGTAPVILSQSAILGSCAIIQKHPTITGYVHSIAIDSANIYLAVTTTSAANGYDAASQTYICHLQKINKASMTTVWDITIPKCTDDMVQNDQYLFLAPEYVDTNLDLYGASWGLLAVRKSDSYLRYLKALHSSFNTANESDRQCYGVQYFGVYAAVQLVVSKKTIIVDLSDVASWGADFPIGGATEKIYSFQIDGVALTQPSNELVLDSDGIFHANTWQTNTIVYKFTDEDIVLTNIPVVESILLESLIESTTIGGHVLDTGGEEITETGFDYSADASDLSNHIESAGTDLDFSEVLELDPGLYYFRAYASNVNGTGYGSIVPFLVGNTITLDKDNDNSTVSLQSNKSGHSVRCCRPAPGIANFTAGTVQDVEGNVYNTIVINEIEWITSDLIVEEYDDESAITHLPDAGDWADDTTGAYCIPE